jgi:hypothetical protein
VAGRRDVDPHVGGDVGEDPIVTNSVVPIAKPPRASATTAITIRTVLRDR